MNSRTIDEPLLSEAAAYFHSRPGLERLLAGFVEKYRSLGRLGGIVVLQDVSSEEKAALEAFFRRRLAGGSLRISAQSFQKALSETKFGELDPVEVLMAWNGGQLVSRQDERARMEEARRAVLAKFMAEFSQPACQAWLKATLAKEPSTRRVQIALNRDPQFASHMAIALRALGSLPGEYRRLPVFAGEVCGDPHGLDIDCEAGKLFLEGLRFLKSADNSSAANNEAGLTDGISSIEEISELLYHFRLLRDDLLNFVTCVGLVAYERQREISYWRSAAEVSAPLNAPLREIVRADAFYPAVLPAEKVRDLPAEGFAYDVFVTENSGVFSALLDEKSLSGTTWRHAPLVCLHGQLKMSSWALLDRLVNSDGIIRYSGDFDPEGLQIAQKLLLRYPGRVRLWHMDAEDYFEAGPATPIDHSRLNKLNSITHPDLAPLAQSIAQTRLAAYQEGILDKLATDICNI